MKIYRMQDEDFWIAAESRHDAVVCYDDWARDSGVDLIGPHGPTDAAVALTDAELDNHTFTDDITQPDGVAPKRSFRAQLAAMVANGETFPCVFAECD